MKLFKKPSLSNNKPFSICIKVFGKTYAPSLWSGLSVTIGEDFCALAMKPKNKKNNNNSHDYSDAALKVKSLCFFISKSMFDKLKNDR